MGRPPGHKVSHLGGISPPPPENHMDMQQNELLSHLKERWNNWTNNNIADAIAILCASDAYRLKHVMKDTSRKGRAKREDGTYTQVSITHETVKKWTETGVKYTKLKSEYREALFQLIDKHSDTEGIATQWKQAIAQSCERKPEDFSKCICNTVLESQKLTHLPALLETDQSLPLATAYVDLSLSVSSIKKSAPNLLEFNQTLAEKINKRIDTRYAIRKSPQNYLDQSNRKTTLILGSPGSGKSSLIKRVALDVAAGNYKHLKIPLFIEARVYWAVRKNNPSLSLIDFAVKELFPLEKDIKKITQSIVLFAKYSSHRTAILFDGLDEIAGDKEAVSIIYYELNQLNNTPISLIVTSRPAGLVASLNESQRCDIVEFDHEAIEILIDNWARQVSSINSENLKLEMFGSSGLVDMARNPFLLTVLCYIKSENPDDQLPQSRVGVYDVLLDLIILQAQRRDCSVLRLNDVDSLIKFALYLYKEVKNGPIQIFNMSHWREFYKKHNVQDVDLLNNILPSRLLSIWNDSDPCYHFLHLSIHEYLVAYAMLDMPLSEVISLRFSPIWRNVFCFYAALLHERGYLEEFESLINILLNEMDVNGLSLIMVSDIFSYASIKNTTPWVKKGLQNKLYMYAESSDEYGQEGIISALADLDSAWLEEKIFENLNRNLSNYDSFSDQVNSDTQSVIIASRQFSCPYEKLAITRTVRAKEVVHNAFWGENQLQGLLSASAYSSLSTPSDRNYLINISATIEPSDVMSKRIFAFIETSRRQNFLPFLEKMLIHYQDLTKYPFRDALMLVAEIGGEYAGKIIENAIHYEMARLDKKFNAFEVVLEAVTKLGGDYADNIFKSISKAPLVVKQEWSDTVRFRRLNTFSSLNDSDLLDTINKNNIDEILKSLSLSSENKQVPNDQVIFKIKPFIGSDSLLGVDDLCIIEASRIDAGRKPLLCDVLLDIASEIYKRIRDPDDVNDEEYLTGLLVDIFDVLGRVPWKSAQSLAKEIMFNLQENEDFLEVVVISSIGQLYKNQPDSSVLAKLKDILFDANVNNTEAAVLAIGQIDIETLHHLQGVDNAVYAMEKIAAENNIMVFDDFWVDPQGNCIEWKKPSKRVLFVYGIDDDRVFDTVSIVRHEISRDELIQGHESSGNIACIVFLNENSTIEQAEVELLEEYKRVNTTTVTHEVPFGLTEDEVRKLAVTIGLSVLDSY